MKKVLLYFLSFLFIFFILPALFTNVNLKVNSNDENNIIAKTNEEDEEENSQQKDIEYNYEKYETIKLLHKASGEVAEVNIDEYLYHVVSAEMPVDYELEALKAQSIVARTYTIFKVKNKKHEEADICDDFACCQAWVSKETRFARWEESKRESNWKKIQEAVNMTKGKIIVYENEPIKAFFHASSGGITEIPINVWGGSGYPYLQVVETVGEDEYTQYASQIELSHEEIIEKLIKKYSTIQIDFDKDEEIQILEYTDGNRVKTIRFGNHNISGVEARTIFGLRSANFEIIKEEGKIKFTVIGYGHGVGMSQTGADAMAKNGSNYDEIIHHYYKGVEIKDINSI